MAKTYEIAFKLAGQLSGNFAKTFKTASQAVSGFGKNVDNLNQQAAQNNQLLKAAQKANQLGQEYGQAKNKAKALESQLASAREELKKISDATQVTQDEFQLASVQYEENKLALQRLKMEMAKVEKPTDEMKLAVNEHALALKKEKAELDKKRQALRALSNASTNVQKLESAFEKESRAVEESRKKLDKQRESLKDLKSAAGVTDSSIESLTKRQKELADASDKARASQEKLAKIQEKMTKVQALNDKVKAKASSGLATVGAIGAGVGAAAGFMMKSGTEYVQALNKMQAQTGATDAQMKKLGQTARALYKDGMGESFEAVTAAMANIQQASGLSGKALQTATHNALLLGDTFDMEVNESTRAATALMKNFGIDAEKAYGLIAYGAQNGANKNGDLLDTLNEYSVHYKALGFDADQFTSHLVAGAESGAFSIDKVGDAIKEFTIRSKDGSKASMDAFAQLGINGEKATAMFAAGGKKAQEAFFNTVKALEEMEDPVARNAAGVALFGTQFEDLEAGALKTFASMKGASVDAAGTLKKINEVRYDDLGSTLTKLSRNFSDSLSPAAQKAATIMNEKMPSITASLNKLTPIISQVAVGMANSLPGVIDKIASAAQTAVNWAIKIKDNWSTIGPIVKTAALAFAALKLGAAVISPVLTLYDGYLKLRGAIEKARQSTLLNNIATKAATAAHKAWDATLNAGKFIAHKASVVGSTIATKAQTVAVKAVAVAQKAWNATLNSGKWIAHKASVVASTVATKAHTVASKAATGAQKLFTAAKNSARLALIKEKAALVASKVAIVAHKVATVASRVAMLAWSGVCKAVTAAQWLWNAALSANPIGAVIALVAGLVAGGIALYKNWDTIKKKAQELWTKIKNIFGKIGNAIANAWEKAKGFFTGKKSTIEVKASGNGKTGSVRKMATGGIATGPTLALIGEGKESEAVLPLSKLDNLLANRGSGGGSMSVSFAPVIHINGGGADAYAQVKRGLDEGLDSFERNMKRFEARKKRLSFA